MTVAIVGMACRFGDARSVQELWENVLAQRRAFRRFPSERLALDDYFSDDRTTPDSIYATQASVIEGYEFDRLHYKVVGSTFRSADLTHWLALDIAAQALADAGFAEGEGLPKVTTGVLLGNTLTGEFSRANTLRLRWPYVRRVLEAKLIEKGILPEERPAFLRDLEASYKEPFAPIGEESLAGNLSNTIAGRICNHFDLKGGGYTLDGACSSSLLAVSQACSALVAKDLDIAIVGGVDLSLDPFELVGFAKAGALASGEMRIYDARSDGFIPGEGCGFVVLMRYEDALAQQKRIYSLIRGWGISSDGQGGITRPEVEGQMLALERAYRRAGFGSNTVTYFEGHGTGTSVGDATELQAINRCRLGILPDFRGENFQAKIRSPQLKSKIAFIGSIKANIGHTKAAAGIAGLIKATMALYSQIIPPITGCDTPHPFFRESSLTILKKGQIWPTEQPLRASVSGMGFGGINSHIALEGLASIRRQTLTPHEQSLMSTPQDAELFLLSAETSEQLQQTIEHLLTIVPRLSIAELGDLAAQLAKILNPSLPIRAAVVASSPDELKSQLETLLKPNSLTGRTPCAPTPPRIGFLFPGQAAPVYFNDGVWERRFAFLKDFYPQEGQPQGIVPTDIAQPAIIAASIAGLKILDYFGINADIAVGHSLGELAALYWAGAIDEMDLIHLAKVRGKAMAELGNPTGKMASIGADEATVRALLNGRVVSIAGLNSPTQTVISGENSGIQDIIEKANAKGIKAVQLPVSHAFHSPLVAAVVQPLAAYLGQQRFHRLQKTVVSTVTGSILDPNHDLPNLLCQQITAPVRFIEAVSQATKDLDLFIEVGPGHILSRLVADFTDIPVVALDVGGSSFRGLLQAIGKAFVLGISINHYALFKGRFTRSFNFDWQPQFFANPCEIRSRGNPCSYPEVLGASLAPLQTIRQLVAQRTELPLEAIKDHQRLLGDLHLNSISVGQLVAEAARSLGLLPPVSPTDYANATVAEVAQALETLASTASNTPVELVPAGVDSWIRTFVVDLTPSPLTGRTPCAPTLSSNWCVIAPSNYPLLASLQQAFNHFQGNGRVICLPPESQETDIDLLLTEAKALIAEPSGQCLVLIQHGGGGAAFARTFYLENPHIPTCVVDVPINHPLATQWVVTEAQTTKSYQEAYYNSSGQRYTPTLRLFSPPLGARHAPLHPSDVLLVTGGGKGIAAECAFSLAKEMGVRLALLGRSHPETDAELKHNLERMRAQGIELIYLSADVTDTEAVKTAIEQIQTELGIITAIIHGAGVNTPKLIQHLDKNDILCTIMPKVRGLQNLLAVIDTEKLRLLVTFGSIIARIGLPGEADYALANEWMGRLVEKFQINYPYCRCLNLEWSIWSGMGMGERLGRIDALMQQGITPIPPDRGIAILRGLIGQSLPNTSVIVSGRLGEPTNLKFTPTELPLQRFLETSRVYYPGVELVVDVELSVGTDLYLNDHIYQGEKIFPGVMGLEAIAQVAMAVLGTTEIPIFEEIHFNRPIVVADNLKIRLAALVQESGKVKVVIRCEQTAFGVDHFEAICVFSGRKPCAPTPLTSKGQDNPTPTPINPQEHLYGNLLFHRGRFQRLQKYYHLRATECVAEISVDTQTQWFSPYLSNTLVLGDPGARDAVIHALQACVPHATILPTRIDRLTIYSFAVTETCFVCAKERKHLGDTFIYDLDVVDAEGKILEQWEGLQLQVIQYKKDSWIATLLPFYLERQIKEFIPNTEIDIVIDQDSTVETSPPAPLLGREGSYALSSVVTRRLDGKPELSNGKSISVAHAGDLTLVVYSCDVVGCDVEPVISRSTETWCDLLGVSQFALANVIAQEKKESLDIAMTRLWAAKECLKKAGIMLDAPLMLADRGTDGVIWLASGENKIGTFAVSVEGFEQMLVFGVLVSFLAQKYRNSATNVSKNHNFNSIIKI